MKPAVLVLSITILASTAMAQNTPSSLGAGSPSVTVGGVPAARQGDTTTDGRTVTSGSSNVFINGSPAATAGSGTDCGGTLVGGSSNVLVNGKPLATTGSVTSPCPAR